MPTRRMNLIGFLCLFLATVLVGCSKPPEPKTDPDAAKKELEDLNNARKKEWK